MRRAVLSTRTLALALAFLFMPCMVQCQDAEDEGEDTFQLGEKKTGDYTLCQDIVKEIRKKGQSLYHTPGPTPANWPSEERDDYELRKGKNILIGWKSIPGESCMSCSPTQKDCPPPCVNLLDYMYWACDGVTLSFGDWYDPGMTISGYWEDAKPALRPAIMKCGCSASSALRPSFWLVLLSGLLLQVRALL